MFFPEELAFLSILSSDVAMAIRNSSLFEDLKVQFEKNQSLFLQTITALAEAIEAKDKYTSGHTERVVEYSLKIGMQLKKMRAIRNWELFQKDLKIAALLHDIGKIGVPEKVLNKKASLNEKEWQIIKSHPMMGEGILNPIKDLKKVILAVRYHHERYDGHGYPAGLAGRKIPLIAAIISVADAYDAMISRRPYRKAFSRKEAISIIKKNSGKQFHPKVVEAFLRIFVDGGKR
jgi:HD-GYP domain-containing protein (c-di-GMP phosphodiesterase class II)